MSSLKGHPHVFHLQLLRERFDHATTDQNATLVRELLVEMASQYRNKMALDGPSRFSARSAMEQPIHNLSPAGNPDSVGSEY
jgi:hypothetical protein